MAAIALTTALSGNGPVTIARTTLSASDTLAYVRGAGQRLFLVNTTAGALTATLTGNAATAINVPGYGGTVAVSGGKAVAVPANSSVLVELDDIYAYLEGTVTVTGGTGLIAHFYQ